jgi:hypothetical protein
MPQYVAKPTYPTDMSADDLNFARLMDVLVADNVYFGVGSYDTEGVNTLFATQAGVKTELTTNLDLLGELAEKPGKADSKITKLKTRNYTIPGKRTSTVELTIAGLSTVQKDYLESHDFMNQEVTIVVVSKAYDRVVIFNGLRWTVDWSGEADGLFSVVISTEFSGITAGRIYLRTDIPPGV